MKNELFFEYEHIHKKKQKKFDKAIKFCEDYKNFMNNAKTERDAVRFILDKVKASGYKDLYTLDKINAGDKIFVNNRDKSVVLFTIGKESLDTGINFVISHIDSPRLDLKANPLYEESDIAYFKTHYYGGIKKYQWPTVPLAMHGRLVKAGGSFIDFNIGEKEEDTRFYITDLLPHLSQEQDKRTLNEGIKGEELNIVVGSIPYIDEEDKENNKNQVKLNILKILNKTYGITEKDFVRAEIEFVPSNKATDIGFDRSLIAAYGQDDKVCAYPALISEIENVNPTHTSCTVFTDKEEIGSDGNTGMVSEFLFDIVSDLCEKLNVNKSHVYRKSICLSSDVNSAYDPTFKSVFEDRNSSFINRGVVLTKFTGHRGKSGSNDASAETVAKVLKLMDDQNIVWQTGELGIVDLGGGGTIAKYMSQRNVDTIDVGVAVLSMHSPYELTSKLDIYETYLAYKAFLLN